MFLQESGKGDGVMDIGTLRENLSGCIEANKDEIIDIGETIYRTPETGFKEFKTAAFVMEKLDAWGIPYASIEEYPGIKVTIDTGRDGPGLAVVGELDAIICREHPDSDKETGAVHACGHNAQIAAMMGALKGLLDAGAFEHLSGKLHFIAVPAEEYIEIAYRMELREKGVIRYLGGKPELLRRGFFDDVDLCISIHSSSNPNRKIAPGSTPAAHGTLQMVDRRLSGLDVERRQLEQHIVVCLVDHIHGAPFAIARIVPVEVPVLLHRPDRFR
jgi:metal-dependent amidase/aminoacylase/carboxypeptidase family protein